MWTTSGFNALQKALDLGHRPLCYETLSQIARPLHVVSQIAGLYECNGNHDIIFKPSIVDAVLKQIKPVAEYHREGNLYLSEIEFSDFVGQGQAP